MYCAFTIAIRVTKRNDRKTNSTNYNGKTRGLKVSGEKFPIFQMDFILLKIQKQISSARKSKMSYLPQPKEVKSEWRKCLSHRSKTEIELSIRSYIQVRVDRMTVEKDPIALR